MKKTFFALLTVCACAIFIGSCSTAYDEAEQEINLDMQASDPDTGTDGGGAGGPDDGFGGD